MVTPARISAARPRNQNTASFTASNPTVLDSDGNVHTINEYWKDAEHGLALIFVRHFGCPFCREHVASLIKRYPEFVEAGIDVVVVGNGTPQRAQVFSHEMGTPFPVLTDPSGEAYAAFRLTKATKRGMLDPHVILGGIRAASRGFFPKPPQGDPMQLQGQFLIDPNGVVWHADRPKSMADIPTADALLSVAKAIWST
jgi:peroxiredoxin